MAMSERMKNIRFVLIAIVVLIAIAVAAFVLFFDFSKSHTLKLDGYEITEGGIRELRVEAKVKTHDYIYPWQRGISGTVDVYDGDTRIERLQLGHKRYTRPSPYEIATPGGRWKDDAWVCENPYSAAKNFYAGGCVAVDEEMEWLVVTNAFSDEPRIWVFASDRDIGESVAERAIGQFYPEDGVELQNPYK